MCHSPTMEHRINRIHERAVRLFYQNQNQLTFKELLEKKNKTISIYQTDLQIPATEIYMAKNRIPPEIVNLLFGFTNKSYNFRNVSVLTRKRNLIVHFGSESLSYLTQRIWELVPDLIKEE